MGGATSGSAVAQPTGDRALLEVADLTKIYRVTHGTLRRSRGDIRAVDGVSFSVSQGETLALVGESGCGKSTIARCILRLVQPTAGSIRFDGHDITAADATALRRYRRRAQIVFQDPAGSLTPRMRVRDLIGEPLLDHAIVAGRPAAEQRVGELLERVGLRPADAGRYPHEFSGGQQQRIVLARALATEPSLILLDEPVSSLDVSVGAQILNLLADLQDELRVAYLFISHDLSLVRHLADRVAVMYLGRIVEHADSDTLFRAPQHPYTQALLSAAPLPDPRRERARQRIRLVGEPPDPLDRPKGCPFHPRCPKARPDCAVEEPDMMTADDGHAVACLYPEPLPIL